MKNVVPAGGLLLSDDLLFSSRVIGTARERRLSLAQVKSVAELEAAAGESPPACVILDLQTPGLDVGELRRRLAEAGRSPRVVGYGSHVDVTTLKAAREAGCDPVLPRSKFVEVLGSELPGWFGMTQ